MTSSTRASAICMLVVAGVLPTVHCMPAGTPSPALPISTAPTARAQGASAAGEAPAAVHATNTDAPRVGVVRIHGIVRATDGPAPGAWVAVTRMMAREPSAVVLTDADGRFAAEVEPGVYGITASSARGAAVQPAIQPVRAFWTAQGEQVLVMSSATMAIAGRVLDEAGQPRAGAMVFAAYRGRNWGEIFTTKTASDGTFMLLAVERDEYQVWASEHGWFAPGAVVATGSRSDLVLRLHPLKAAPDEVVTWMRANAIRLATTEPASGVEDLEPLLAIVGDARVVALGESTPGTREFFQLKHRVLELLVEKLGFTGLAIEANWHASLVLDEYVRHGAGDARAALEAMQVPTWETEELLALVEWMRAWNASPSHGRKLTLQGIEAGSPGTTIDGIVAYVARMDPALASSLARDLAPMAAHGCESIAYRSRSKEEQAHVRQAIEAALVSFDAHRRSWIAATSERVFVIARHHVEIAQQDEEYLSSAMGHDVLERAKAANVRWLLDAEPPGARIALWTDDAHASRVPAMGEEALMGTHLATSLDADYVALGFSYDRGSFRAHGFLPGGGLHAYTLGPAPAEDVGAAFARTGLPLLAINLRLGPVDGVVGQWLVDPHPKREIRRGAYWDERDLAVPSRLSERFDAIFFVAQTTSSRPLAH